MRDNKIGLFSNIIESAILNKYAYSSPRLIGKAVTLVLTTNASSDEQTLIGKLRQIQGIHDDINNQTVVLALIDRYWSNPPKLERPLTILNTFSYGRIDPAFRRHDYIEDFGGKVPTPKDEVRARLDELERLCRESVSGMGGSRLEDKALILAHIFGSLIRIHPFEDGNGRTARLFAFYALKCWRLPIFPIPKVRNDVGWKDAMDFAVAGDACTLKNELFWRMEHAVNSCDSDEGK